MTEELLKKLSNYIIPNESINLAGMPANDDEIKDAEKQLNIKFHDDYISFIKKFGGAYAGIPIYAFTNNEMLSTDSIVDLTNSFREDYADDYRSKIIKESYVISFDGSGNPILINKKGEVIIFYHDNNEYKILSGSLSKLLEDILDGKMENEF
ncbi:Knr4/Smi1-like domain-containing protein [Flavobacterium branchiophilum]|uniref:Knr4/Smi1-like domain-containing protein n=1 Tax=Flavobacterium branchiophilum (strain FL-15) TaxID=1034807 RepID=G2Z5P5_FLABF|nr:SMI1/KNR4 family protein [Flavobacterium branchiophilum]CCB70843.1 Hypothetical protein FBFL15_2881 [Flavobacterium branchiophilum FL-15]